MSFRQMLSAPMLSSVFARFTKYSSVYTGPVVYEIVASQTPPYFLIAFIEVSRFLGSFSASNTRTTVTPFSIDFSTNFSTRSSA